MMKGAPTAVIELALDAERYLNPDAYGVGDRYMMLLDAGQLAIRICERIFMLKARAAARYAAWRGGQLE